jgi:DNA-directed RNA polymerase I, II, and III subunit RPABC2
MKKRLSKYEYTRIIGTRAVQIAMNSPVFIDIGDETDPIEIAKMEFKEKKLPFIIQKKFPDGSICSIPVSEFQI